MAAITASDIFKASMGIDYLKRFMPDDLLNLLDDGQKAGANNAARTLLTTPSNYKPRSPTASDTGGGGGEGRSLDGVGGLGSLSSLMDNPSLENLQGLQNFAALNDTMLGRAMLDALGAMLDFAINPAPGPIGLAQGIAAGLESKMLGTSKISDSLKSFSSIPRQEAIAANRAAIAMNYSFNNMTPEEVENISLVSYFGALSAATKDTNPINDPTIESVGYLDGKPAINVKGTFGGVRTYDPQLGGWIATYGGKYTAKTKEELEEAAKKRNEVRTLVRTAAALNNPVDPQTEAEIGGGRTGPEMSYGAAIINSALTYDPEDLPDEIDAAFSYNPADLPDEIEAAKSFNPSAGVPNFGEDDDDDEEDAVTSITGPETSTSIGPGFSFNDDAGGDGGGSGGGTGGTSGTSGGFDVADAMGGNAGGIDGTSDSSGSDGISDDAGSGFKRGGFVHKRKTKKKKTRRGLASR